MSWSMAAMSAGVAFLSVNVLTWRSTATAVDSRSAIVVSMSSHLERGRRDDDGVRAPLDRDVHLGVLERLGLGERAVAVSAEELTRPRLRRLVGLGRRPLGEQLPDDLTHLLGIRVLEMEGLDRELEVARLVEGFQDREQPLDRRLGVGRDERVRRRLDEARARLAAGLESLESQLGVGRFDPAEPDDLRHDLARVEDGVGVVAHDDAAPPLDVLGLHDLDDLARPHDAPAVARDAEPEELERVLHADPARRERDVARDAHLVDDREASLAREDVAERPDREALGLDLEGLVLGSRRRQRERRERRDAAHDEDDGCGPDRSVRHSDPLESFGAEGTRRARGPPSMRPILA